MKIYFHVGLYHDPKNKMPTLPYLPAAPRAIQKGVPLANLLNTEMLAILANNIRFAYPEFDAKNFLEKSNQNLENLALMPRAAHIAQTLKIFLPENYPDALNILIHSMTPARQTADSFGLAEFFYLPHSFFIAQNGLDFFEDSMRGLYELTLRFTSEFAIRDFLLIHQDKTLNKLNTWLNDPNPHIRRLCSEGSRPRLPWGKHLPNISKNPKLTLNIIENLKNDESLYVRRSVANHLGDMAKTQAEFVQKICEKWLGETPDKNLKWVIRHAVRHPAKQNVAWAVAIRAMAA